MTEFERKLPTEDADIAEIVRGILTLQTRNAVAQMRPLGRGTHRKGVCVRAQFEVFDVKSAVRNPAIAARLARGMFAKPGIYPATVRFANANARVMPDSKADVRALSFFVELPPGVMGPDASRLDYSLNGATTFPINDAHAFAAFMKYRTADSLLQALRSLRFAELLAVAKILVRAARQMRGPIRPYQQIRYWSNVPFLHGPDDAVKYSALPSPANHAEPLRDAPNCLRDELVRHVNEDETMSSFDFALQFLDADHMTHGGVPRDAAFWIENGSAEWKETDAPFHTVGRLTLVPRSPLSPDECEAMYIDVTEHSTPESRPLGSLNRARWAAEHESRKKRFASPGVVPSAPAVPPRRPRVLGVLKWTAITAAAIVATVAVVGFVYGRLAAAQIPPLQRVDEVRYLNQGWGVERESPDRETYYYTPQGTSMHGIRYSWFVNLERPFGRNRFADPDHLRSLNFIVDPVPTRSNPDQLPVGFARRYDDTLNDYVADLTCAACHTGQLNVTRDGRTVAIRIDGGQAMNAFTDMKPGHFQLELGLSLVSTFINPLKFNRFASRALEPDYASKGLWARSKDKWTLRWDMWDVLKEILAQALATDHTRPSEALYPVQEGFGRTDALARIANTVFGDHLDPVNYHVGNAPVSFPYLWNIWKFNWVQYGASVSQPLARNVGEAMGTGATFRLIDGFGRPVPQDDRYRTSISFDNLLRIESTLQTLRPPRWPEDLLGPIDQAKAERGKTLFMKHCVGCHGPHVAADAVRVGVSPLRQPTDPLWVIRLKDVKDIGTDPNAALNFVNNTVDLTRAGLTQDEVRPLLRRELEEQKRREDAELPALEDELQRRTKAGADAATLDEMSTELDYLRKNHVTDDVIAQRLDAVDLKHLNAGAGLNILGLMIRERYYTDRHFPERARQCFAGFATLDTPQVEPGYKPRPLEGVWATPPFLHNGSVPNVYELLSPVAERSKRFMVGTREFDPVKVGYVTTPAISSGFEFDATLPGNSDAGHEFRKGYVPFDEYRPASEQSQGGAIGPGLTPPERMDLIEYLKIHRDDPDAQVDRTPPDCFALLQGAPATGVAR